MEPWRKNLHDYMVAKSKPRDMVTFITTLTVKLIAILQDIQEALETYESFGVELSRRRFNNSMSFPIEASSFVIKYDGEELVQYDFSWVAADSTNEIHLCVALTNHCHLRFDDQLKIDMDSTPDWLEQCKYCEPIFKFICSADDLDEDLVAGVIIEYFQTMTKPYLS